MKGKGRGKKKASVGNVNEVGKVRLPEGGDAGIIIVHSKKMNRRQTCKTWGEGGGAVGKEGVSGKRETE